MRWSNFFIPTRKEVPKEAENVSHKLMLRAGLIRPLSSGVYIYLPLGWRVLKKIQKIIREEMDKIGAQELLMPGITPATLWKESGRWEEYGDLMFRLTDRKNIDMALAPTHEEIIASIIRDDVKSYRDLPQIWYQIQIKYRDEMRPRGAVLRARTFIMKDSYSLDRDYEGLEKSFLLHEEAYKNIFSTCGLKTEIVTASSGIMGGSESKEFMIISNSGEDLIITCPKCKKTANLEAALPLPSEVNFKDTDLQKVHTPVPGTVEEISKFLKVSSNQLMKSLLYIKDNNPIWIIIRGDYEIDEEKLEREFGEISIASSEEVLDLVGTSVGYVSPIDTKYPVYADISIKEVVGLVSGANEEDYHYKGINPERDMKIDKYIDIRQYKEGDICPDCKEPVDWKSAIELGHIFKLGTKYSETMGAYYLDYNGKKKPIVMGSYGIGVERIMAAAIEQYHDKKGIIWPKQITPFHILLMNLNVSEPKGVALAEDLYRLLKRDYEVLFDDRDERAGYKFNDADLIGIPLQIIIGSKGLEKGKVEIKNRKTGKKEKAIPEMVKEVIDNLWENI